ncbi:hypothetical protein [Burkholderia pseudomallei]|uniref:hypothetical protein n=1 Tax=Burkholderia pseudomallei TaxID=28450 RepID=UPI00155FF67E|nr:hypothetical protein [Burkholderia pseudomallei]
MKVVLTEKVRALQKDVQGAKELRDFIASAKLNEAKEIKGTTEQGKQLKFRAKLVPQG